jgi:major vault protein
MPDIQGQLVLAQNQHAFIQDSTKGTVQVYAGPHALALSGNDRPVVYDKQKDEFVGVELLKAITQNPLVPEGHYLILENPVTDRTTEARPLMFPKAGANSPVSLEVGRKINIPGPQTFPLWPGQFAQAVPGHHLRSNQYLVIRVYNAEHANRNRPNFLMVTAPPVASTPENSGHASTTPPTAAPTYENLLTPGQQVVIKGTEVSFFIPPTGFEVLKDDSTSTYVREALTLERLEYAILLDEDGNKRYERGPKVVFPEATERFVSKNDGGQPSQVVRKFKALELNDQMGLYIKVIADYTEDDGKTQRKTGDELFITGKVQRIYYPRPEHALIEYDDPNQKSFKRQRYYGITIPKGEGRYVLDKEKGQIDKEVGPQIFLPDPRNQVIIRRTLDDKTVALWYPGNSEALNFNQNLRALTEDATGYLADAVVLTAAADVTRGMNRGTKGSAALLGASASAFESGDTMRRGSKFTPPPMLTLNSKYDGVPSINVWTGWAVQVVDKAGNRRVVIGPATILLEYDESLEILELSTGKPKTTDRLIRDTYLRVDNNLVSDIVRIETKDLVNIDLKLSYRINFLREHSDKWFSVENYVKFACDHMRSLLKGNLKKLSIKEIMENSAAIIRDTILGAKKDNEVRKREFPENGMEMYDVEVLGVEIADNKIAALLKDAQTKAVESAITLSANEQNLENTRRQTKIQTEIQELQTQVKLRTEQLDEQLAVAKAERAMGALRGEIEMAVVRGDAELATQQTRNDIAEADLDRRKADGDYELLTEERHTGFFEKRMAAITPNLIEAMHTLAHSGFAIKLSEAIAPLAINEQSGLGQTLERVFKGTGLEVVLDNLKSRSKTTSGN